jgi:hypothetical protein
VPAGAFHTPRAVGARPQPGHRPARGDFAQAEPAERIGDVEAREIDSSILAAQPGVRVKPMHDRGHGIARRCLLRHVEQVHRPARRAEACRIHRDLRRIGIPQIHRRRNAEDVEQVDIEQRVHAGLCIGVTDQSGGIDRRHVCARAAAVGSYHRAPLEFGGVGFAQCVLLNVGVCRPGQTEGGGRRAGPVGETQEIGRVEHAGVVGVLGAGFELQPSARRSTPDDRNRRLRQRRVDRLQRALQRTGKEGEGRWIVAGRVNGVAKAGWPLSATVIVLLPVKAGIAPFWMALLTVPVCAGRRLAAPVKATVTSCDPWLMMLTASLGWLLSSTRLRKVSVPTCCNWPDGVRWYWETVRLKNVSGFAAP